MNFAIQAVSLGANNIANRGFEEWFKTTGIKITEDLARYSAAQLFQEGTKEVAKQGMTQIVEKEAAEYLTKTMIQKGIEETAEIAAQQGVKQIAQETTKTITKEASKQIAQETTKTITKEASKQIASQSAVPFLASTVGKTVLSGSVASVFNIGYIVISKNKGLAIMKAIPSIGIALIPGIGIPASIVSNLASNYLCEKLYRWFNEPEIIQSREQPLALLESTQLTQDFQVNLKQFLPRQIQEQTLELLAKIIRIVARLLSFFCGCRNKPIELLTSLRKLLDDELKSKLEGLFDEFQESLFGSMSLEIFKHKILLLIKKVIERVLAIIKLIKYIKNIINTEIKSLGPCPIESSGDLAADLFEIIGTLMGSFDNFSSFFDNSVAPGVYQAVGHLQTLY